MSAPASPSIPSTANSSRTASPAGSTRQPATTLPNRRPNRAALRDYYNLKSASQPSTPPASTHNGHNDTVPPQLSSPTTTQSLTHSSALDAPGFDPPTHIQTLLSSEGLEGVLRVESGLINEIKGLDGERKALVYDNYSKLITATDTIRRMRKDMGATEMAGQGMLGPAVGHIAETVRGLKERSGHHGVGQGERRGQRETVRWVLDSGRRLGGLLEEGRREDAEEDWREVRGLLEKWEGVRGVDEVRGECERVMREKQV